MKIVVNHRYTYETDEKVKVGDIVVLPTAEWLRDTHGDTWEATVTSLTSEYDGPCNSILSVKKKKKIAK